MLARGVLPNALFWALGKWDVGLGCTCRLLQRSLSAGPASRFRRQLRLGPLPAPAPPHHPTLAQVLPTHSPCLAARPLTGERAVFQPRSALFQEAVGEHIREVLEGALHTQACLSEGDWVEVGFGGQSWDLRVRELQPEAQVCLCMCVCVVGG